MIKIRAYQDAVDFETSVADVRRRSERVAWRIAIASTVLAVLAGAAMFVMLPLKERLPYLVMANAYTGEAVMAQLGGPLPRRLSGNQAMDRANLATFVRARESFDATTLGDRDWNQVFAMASAEVGAAYRQVHDPASATQPFKLYGTHAALRPELDSLQLDPRSIRGAYKATIRFTRRVVDKSTGSSRILDRQIAEIEYRYVPELALDEHNRLLNPLGFQVTAYRVDRDFRVSGSTS